jgi:CubicO group peptidase (beta-lactamase class C family)
VANVILQLVGEGKVGLDDHITRWVADVPNGDRITIRQLLNQAPGRSGGGGHLDDDIRLIDARTSLAHHAQ